MSAPKIGTLYLVPAPLDFGCDAEVALTEVLPDGTLRQAAQLTHWICENAKSCRAYLKRIADLHPLALPLQQQQITELPREVHKKGDHGAKGGASFDARALLVPLLAAVGGVRVWKLGIKRSVGSSCAQFVKVEADVAAVAL